MDNFNGGSEMLPEDKDKDKQISDPYTNTHDNDGGNSQRGAENGIYDGVSHDADKSGSRSTGIYQINHPEQNGVLQQDTVYYNVNVPPRVDQGGETQTEAGSIGDTPDSGDHFTPEPQSAVNGNESINFSNNTYNFNVDQNMYFPGYPYMPHQNTGVSDWYKKPSVTVPKGYNPYRDDLSVYEEIKTESKGAVKGPEPLERETIQEYNARCFYEWNYTRNAAKKKMTKSTNYLGLVLLLEFLLSISISIIISIPLIGERATAEIINTLNNVAMILQFCMLYPVLILTANIGCKHKFNTFFHKPQMSALSIIKWSLVSLGLTYVVSFIFDFIFDIISSLGFYVNDLSSPVPTEPADIIIYGLAVVIGAPIFEEVVFRGILLTHQMKYGCWHAAIVSGLLFGLFHQNHSQMFFAAAIGILFAFIDIKAGSIIPSIIAHMAVNGFSFINMLLLSFTNYNELYESGNLDAALEGPGIVVALVGFLNLFVFLMMAAAVVVLIVEFAVNRKQFRLPKGDSGLTTEEKVGAFFRSPAMIVLIIILSIMVVLNSFVPII